MNIRYHSPTSFLDLLFNCLVGFVFLFVMAFLMINPVINKSNIKTKAEFVIKMTWPDNNPNDIDIWLQDPSGKVASYKNKEMGLMHLDRDDLGSSNDTFTLPDGRTIRIDTNQEIMTIRGIIPGEWTLNIFFYKDNGGGATPVKIEIIKLNPSVITVYSETTTVEIKKPEVTVLRFTLSNEGEVLKTNTLFKKLVLVKADSIYGGTERSTAPATGGP